jgi:hypothetical protein
MSNPKTSHEWLYALDDLGIVYCTGRRIDEGVSETVATYYETSADLATKQLVDADVYYRRYIYQGLPEERERLAQVERPEVVDRLLSRTSLGGVGISIEDAVLVPSNPRYSDVAQWTRNAHPRTAQFRTALAIAGAALERAEVNIEDLSLYGGAAFGVVNKTEKAVDDVDFVFSPQQRGALDNALGVLRSEYTWSDIDPFNRLPKERQLLKAKRWSTSQVRLDAPYPFSIDFKVRRNKNDATLWDSLPESTDTVRYLDTLKIIDDTEALCTSPALRGEDNKGNERIVLFDGYQYIGCAIAGDEITVSGSVYRDSNVVRVSQSDSDGVAPDFRNVPIM